MLALFRELLAYRALIHILVARDLKARYRGSVLGLLWTLLNPLLHMGIYALLFSVYMRSATERYASFTDSPVRRSGAIFSVAVGSRPS